MHEPALCENICETHECAIDEYGVCGSAPVELGSECSRPARKVSRLLAWVPPRIPSLLHPVRANRCSAFYNAVGPRMYPMLHGVFSRVCSCVRQSCCWQVAHKRVLWQLTICRESVSDSAFILHVKQIYLSTPFATHCFSSFSSLRAGEGHAFARAEKRCAGRRD